MGQEHARKGTQRARHAASDELGRPSRLLFDSTKQTTVMKHSRGKPGWSRVVRHVCRLKDEIATVFSGYCLTLLDAAVCSDEASHSWLGDKPLCS
jgi:hypothetical protein